MKPLPQILIFASLTICAVFLFSGCSNNALARWEQTRDLLRNELSATTRSLPALQREIDALPPGPARDRAMAAMGSAEALVPQLSNRLENLDQIITSARGGDAGSLGAGVGGLLSGVPVIGPYAGLIGLLAGMGWGAYQRLQRSQEVDTAAGMATELRGHMKRVIDSIEQAGPDWTAEQKAAVRAIQGEQTSKLVEKLKGE